MTDLKVGDKIPDAATLDGLPTGTAVTLNGSQKLLTKHSDGWAQHRDYGGRHNGHAMWFDGMEIVSMPEAYMGPEVGDTVTTAAEMEAMPGDAVLADITNREHRVQKVSALTFNNPQTVGQWHDIYNGGTCDTTEILRRYSRGLIVESLPDAAFETVRQFQWRFRDLSITGAERAQGNANSATNVLGRIPIEFTPSVGMRITNQLDRDALPEGTRVYIGKPEDPASFAIFRKEGRNWSKVFGQPNKAASDAVAVVIDALPDKTEPDDWMTEVPDDEERQRVAVMKRQVWTLGFKEKQDRGWCDEFERIMLRGGLSEDATKVPLPGGFRIGDTVTPEQAVLLPLGTVLRTDHEDGTFTIYRRSTQSRNAAGTRRLMTTLEGVGATAHYSKHMTIVKEGDGTEPAGENGDGLTPASVAEMDAMPLGTGLYYPRHGRVQHRYIKVARGWVQVAQTEGEPTVDPGAYANRAADFSPGAASMYRYDFTYSGRDFS